MTVTQLSKRVLKNLMSAVRTGQNPAKNRNGFTLIEILVALSVISIVLITVFRLQSQTIFMNHLSRFNATAPFLAQGKLAELEMNLPEAPVSDSGDFGDDFPGYQWRLTITQVASETLGDNAPLLGKIDIDVALNENQYAYHLRTYR